MNLPQSFITTIQNAFGEEGRLWLDRLPVLVAEAESRWKLTDIQPIPNPSYNFVAFALCTSTSPSSGFTQGAEEVVLKISVPNKEVASEIAALRFFDGNSAVHLLEADDEHFMFLLERLKPGETLAALEDDDRATLIAADVMLNLWQPVSSLESRSKLLGPQRQAAELQSPFIRLTDWFSELKKVPPRFNGGTGPFDEKIIAEVEELLPRLFAESNPPMLVHGDLHHFNILSSERSWLAIDPKGVIGPAAYEVGPLLINPWPDLQKISQHAERRIAILSERLGFSRKSLRDWALCHSVLSAWWDMKPDGSGGEYSLACSEVFSKIK